MPRAFVRVVLAATFGALAAASLAVIFHASWPSVVLDMDRDLPDHTSGFHPVERSGENTFVWTSGRSVLRLAQLDRRIGWTCAIRLRGLRQQGASLPEVTLNIDGATSVSAAAGTEFRDVTIQAGPRPSRAGLTLTIATAPTFVPGPDDNRVLGVQVDRIRCDPDGAFAVLPVRAISAAALGAGAFAGAAMLAGLTASTVSIVTLVIAVGLAVLVTTSGGAFGAYPVLAGRFTGAIALVALAIVRAPALWRRRPIEGAAAVAVVSAAVMLCLKLTALLHPAKTLIDAVFQAHRFEWVLSGRYFFTQPLPSGVEFPYAIGLYVAAMPWAAFVTDHVLLLRVVVLVSEAVAGVLLYPVIARAWGDRQAGVLAVILYGLVPLPYVVVGNANLTNAFAQSVALMAVALVALRSSSPRPGTTVLWLTLLTALAVLSHVSTMVLLVALLTGIAVTFLSVGGRELRTASGAILLSVALASVVATGLYYRHFVDVYREGVAGVRAEVPATPGAPSRDDVAPGGEGSGGRVGRSLPVLSRQLDWHERLMAAARGTVLDLGWPLLVLSGIGSWRIGARGRRDPLSLLVIAWVGVWVGFLILGTMTRVDTQYQRYAAEFIGRVNLAMYPAAVILGAFGASWAWRDSRSTAWRAASVTLAMAALVTGGRFWIAWIL